MRQQRPRGSTTRAAVVNAALDIVDHVGVEALTIRAVAQAVGAPPMSLYTHFVNKEELLDLMLVEVTRRLYADSERDTWEAALWALVNHFRDTLLAHPRWNQLLSRPASPTPSPERDRILSLMVEAGLPHAEALQTLSAAIVSTLGLVLVELTFREPDGASAVVRRFERTRHLLEDEPTSEPTSTTAFVKVRQFDFYEVFRLAIQALIDAAKARAAARAVS